MNPLIRIDGVLHMEGVALDEIARVHGMPTYVYSRAALESAYQAYAQALAEHPHLICYAVKANSNLAVLNLFARLGAGFDIVSGGELARVLAAGGDPRKVVFSGVGKTETEMRAALEADILCFNVESAAELRALDRVAGELGRRARISLRVNPDVDARTHPYIATGLKESKFGIPYAEAHDLYLEATGLPNLQVTGIDCHIGSQLLDTEPFAQALTRILALVDRLATEGIRLQHIDMGGGLGVRYGNESVPAVNDYVRVLLDQLAGRSEHLIVEPGRSLVANAGVLLTRVLCLKHGEARDFAIVDAAMNDLMRPSLYDAWHDVQPVRPHSGDTRRYQIVGPVCESGDFLARDRDLALTEGDLLAIASAGAYGMSMSSNYNTRPRAAEVVVDGSATHLVRERERVADLFAGEHLLP
ncbi:MAG: diaminopimelate decarboxylase [Thiobacillaceae bacterium]